MTYQRSAAISLFFSVFAVSSIGCSSQSFNVGSVATNDAGDGSGLDAAAPLPIDPIAVGNSWTYAIKLTGSYPLCPNADGTSQVTQHANTGGRDAFLVTSFCSQVSSFWFSAVGDQVSEYSGSGTEWVTALAAPVQEGQTWSNGTTSFIWHNAGTVSDTAGTFGDCWEVDDQAGSQYYAVTFCRGIGPVTWHVRDATGANGYDAVLTAKTIN